MHPVFASEHRRSFNSPIHDKIYKRLCCESPFPWRFSKIIRWCIGALGCPHEQWQDSVQTVSIFSAWIMAHIECREIEGRLYVHTGTINILLFFSFANFVLLCDLHVQKASKHAKRLTSLTTCTCSCVCRDNEESQKYMLHTTPNELSFYWKAKFPTVY